MVEPAYRKLGWPRPTPTGSCSTAAGSADHLPGRRGRVPNFLKILDDGRVAIAALAIGAAEACLDHSLGRQGAQRLRRPIGRYQAVSFALADLAVAVENARLLT
jgi:alkylation response protein AidB-like acyl-CoA dehydrogenase